MIKKYCTIILLLIASHLFYAQSAPNPKDDYDTVEINTALIIAAPGVLENDTDANGDPLTVTKFTVNGRVFQEGETANISQGSIVIKFDGSYTFTPTPGYFGNTVPVIRYFITDGTSERPASLFLTVEKITDLLEITGFGSCNQGFTVDNEYKIIYNVRIENKSTARDYNESSLIRNIDLTSDFASIYGNGCVIRVEDVSITPTQALTDFVNDPYPIEFASSIVNPSFLDGSSNSFFTSTAENPLTLYPRQTVDIQYCIIINPFCGGRPNPTPSGSNINFNNVLKISSDVDNTSVALQLDDFHTTEAIVTAGFFVQDVLPVNSDGTFSYTNSVIITNEGTSATNNFNYNMGLGSFLDNGIAFRELTVTQVSGPPILVNTAYDGDSNTLLLQPNNTLSPGETVILEVFAQTELLSTEERSFFSQDSRSQTQGSADGSNEMANKKYLSFVNWSDGLGNHLDRYYLSDTTTEKVSSRNQCVCASSSMIFSFESSASNQKEITNINDAPNGVLEQQEVTFQITATNTSNAVELKSLQIEDNLSTICAGKIISVTLPEIVASTAKTDPLLNALFDGSTDINIFDGSSGVLEKGQSITVAFTVNFSKSCRDKTNTSIFTSKNPLGNLLSASSAIAVNISLDTDGDNIDNDVDLDDDNDTILDTDEYNGLNPLDDDDNDFVPNYRDTDYDIDANSDGIIDVFDFDNDGVPNHFDLDSDNDGVLDIAEVGNILSDATNDGRTDVFVGANGLDNTIENNDSFTSGVNYTISNTDANGNPNFIDIDADGDGIVDIIEAQLTNSYVSPNGVITENGIDTQFPNGIAPVDTDNDAIPDYIDTNSDDDSRDDSIEGWDANSDGIAEIVTSNIDFDNDGLDDAFDADNGRLNPTNGQSPADFPNIDNADNPERDWREIIAIVVLIDSISNTEGEDFVFTISLVAKNDNAILVESAFQIELVFSTADGPNITNIYSSAIAPFDYNQISNIRFTITPAATATQATVPIQFTVNSLEDPIFEVDEQFTLKAAVTSNNTVNLEANGMGTIIDNDPAPSITMNDSREEEGKDLVHNITLSNPSSRPIVINVSTNDNLAVSSFDYSSISENLTIEGTKNPNDANLEVSFSIATLIDNLNELEEETLNVTGTVSSESVGVQDLTKKGTIVDIDPDPLIVIDSLNIREGDTSIFTIKLLNTSLEPMRNYLPISLILETIDDTASSIRDFIPFTIATSIPALEFSIEQSAETVEDRLNEMTETFFLEAVVNSLSTVSNVSRILGVAKIIDDDFPNLFSPNGDSRSDEFKILGIESSPNFKLVIYDRWGSEVYNYRNSGRAAPIWWNGETNGKPAPAGVYYYTLDFNDGLTKTRTNFIQLVR